MKYIIKLEKEHHLCKQNILKPGKYDVTKVCDNFYQITVLRNVDGYSNKKEKEHFYFPKVKDKYDVGYSNWSLWMR